jgi:hypothetical protein
VFFQRIARHSGQVEMALKHVPEFAAFGGQRQLLAADYGQRAVNERLHTIAVSQPLVYLADTSVSSSA